MSKQEALQQTLINLRTSLPELRGALIASVDGLTMAHHFSSNEDPNRVAAMAATALGLGKRISDTLNVGTLSETSVLGADGQVNLYSAGPKGVLAIVAKQGANTGLVNLEARETAKKIAELL